MRHHTTFSNRVTTLFCVTALAAGILLCGSKQAEATVWSLANDFSLASNTNSTTWSYGLEGNVDAPVDMQLFATNTRIAQDLWGTTFATSPTMWSDASGFWGIGRNDTGVTQTAGTVSWAPGEILLHPQTGFPGRLVVSWLSPVTGTVDIDYSFATATNEGNGAGIQIVHNSTVLSGFHNPYPATETDSINGLAVTAGDRLYFQFDVWGDPSGDITRFAVTIDDGVAIPEPSSFVLAALGLVGLGWFGWRRRR